jgi:3-hydroxyisobutyrate dehydrogenase-like beta-hydroxyacid dehydrogenase
MRRCSRTPKEAWEGTLDTPWWGPMMSVFRRLEPVLDTWAGKIVHIGGDR